MNYISDIYKILLILIIILCGSCARTAALYTDSDGDGVSDPEQEISYPFNPLNYVDFSNIGTPLDIDNARFFSFSKNLEFSLIEYYNATNDDELNRAIKFSIKANTDLIAEMSGGLKSVIGSSISGYLESDFNESTAIWEDDDLIKIWDISNDLLTTGGTTLLAQSSISDNDNTSKVALGILATGLLSSIVSKFVIPEKRNETLQRIELNRQAYQDVKIRKCVYINRFYESAKLLAYLNALNVYAESLDNQIIENISSADLKTLYTLSNRIINVLPKYNSIVDAFESSFLDLANTYEYYQSKYEVDFTTQINAAKDFYDLYTSDLMKTSSETIDVSIDRLETWKVIAIQRGIQPATEIISYDESQLLISSSVEKILDNMSNECIVGDSN